MFLFLLQSQFVLGNLAKSIDFEKEALESSALLSHKHASFYTYDNSICYKITIVKT